MRDMQIIYCDTDIYQIKVMETVLKKMNCDYNIWRDGNNCMGQLKNNKVHLLITSMFLPFYNAFEITDFVRNRLISKIPIIVFADQRDRHFIPFLLQSGVTKVLLKPIDSLQIINEIEELNYNMQNLYNDW
jgi:PleD family two-component response regulator